LTDADDNNEKSKMTFKDRRPISTIFNNAPNKKEDKPIENWAPRSSEAL
jgi:hypothetical protein